MIRSLVVVCLFLPLAATLRCFEGTLVGLSNNSKTAEKDCGGMSNYCVQRIDTKNGEMRRECSSWSDEHSMEEKCPMSGCHYLSKDETFCCCQFDGCNEWKGDGTEFRAGETVVSKTPMSSAPTSAPRKTGSSVNLKDLKWNVDVPTTKAPPPYKDVVVNID